MFRALRVSKETDAPAGVDLETLSDDDLMPGDVTVDVEYSSINFKDGLALAGKPGVIRQYPLIPGIDLVGTVAASDSDEWHVGDRVILNGWGVGETHHGGLAERARVRGDWLVPLPAGLSPAAGGRDRHRRLHRDARGAGAGAQRRAVRVIRAGVRGDESRCRGPPGPWRMCWSPARPEGSVRSPSRSCRPSAIG